MRPRVLYELSRQLAVLLEQGLEGERGARIPVLVCHPLDLLQDSDAYGKQAAAVLYPFSVVPEERWRPVGWTVQSMAGVAAPGGGVEGRDPDALEGELAFPPLWVRVRYVFLLIGGTIEEQLEALAAALRTLHEHGTVALGTVPRGTVPLDAESFPLRLLGDAGAWRELGLSEHHLTIAFEVTVPIPSSRTESASQVTERDVRLDEEVP